MGARATREQVEHLASTVGHVPGLSKEDLAGCVASLADMAHTGTHTSLPEIRINGKVPDMTAVQCEKLQNKVKSRLQRQMAMNEEQTDDAHKQLQLLSSLESQDDSTDWATMRRWLVWCLHNNLDDAEGEDDTISLRLTSKSSSLAPTKRSNSRLQRQSSIDLQSNRQRLTSKRLQPSYESDSDRSAQNSFDSTGSTG